ncbi:hypothetical protein TNCV_712341 [Trichonephila clavipes]|nr:hypothetical protein TNCV_712341 [Trichonephila clavipes]
MIPNLHKHVLFLSWLERQRNPKRTIGRSTDKAPSQLVFDIVPSTREPNRGISISNPVLSREELIINIYSSLQLACGEEFISTTGISVIAFYSFTGVVNDLRVIRRFQ